MPRSIRRSVRFTLHFNKTPLLPDDNCLSPYTAPVEALELLCDGKLLHTYSRSDGSITREYWCDTSAHSFTLRTCGTVRLTSSVSVEAGSLSYGLEAAEADRFRLTVSHAQQPPADIDIMEYATAHAVAEELAAMLADWSIDNPDGGKLLISFGEDSFGVYPQTDALKLSDGKTDTYEAIAALHPDGKHFSRLSVRNRSHLQRYVFGYLRAHPELSSFRFEWHDTYLRAAAIPQQAPDLQKLCHEIHHGRIAQVFDDMNVRYARLFAEPTGFTIHCYNEYRPNSAPMAGRSLRYKLQKQDMDRFSSPARLHAALAAALRRSEAAYIGSNIRAEDCDDYIELSLINDPYFTFD